MLVVLAKRNVSTRPGIAEFLSKSKVDNIYEMRGIVSPHYKIRGFNVSMHKISRVYKLKA